MSPRLNNNFFSKPIQSPTPLRVVWAKMVKIINFMFYAQKMSSGKGALATSQIFRELEAQDNQLGSNVWRIVSYFWEYRKI